MAQHILDCLARGEFPSGATGAKIKGFFISHEDGEVAWADLDPANVFSIYLVKRGPEERRDLLADFVDDELMQVKLKTVTVRLLECAVVLGDANGSTIIRYTNQEGASS